ncbi:integrin alpha-8-like isoform X2 [Paramacrobiotus metropolitanus]|uniref:integrin alpha-8-like isoform X2 n=1 Tax=Paramacrobiotus metropolitanus TaxID=2943436 RepID=UPI0024458197|nr:integrin alpha-8-like isoform X2 [Paramacrobiotus metropolitanus]
MCFVPACPPKQSRHSCVRLLLEFVLLTNLIGWLTNLTASQLSAPCHATMDASVRNFRSNGRGSLTDRNNRSPAAGRPIWSGRALLCPYYQWLIVITVMAMANLSSISVSAFNLDLSSAVTHQGEAGSMFGFTVLQHTDKGKQMLLVGAPEAQTTQADVIKGGSVFKCSITQPVCQEIIFDSKGPNIVPNPMTRANEPLDDKSGQWLGASIASASPDGPVAVCAPRYVYFSPSFSKREPVGTCYVGTESLTEFREYSPCRQGSGSSGYHQQGSCQAGFSAAVSRDGSRLFMGAPGTWYWQGQEHSASLTNRDEVLATVESPPHHDDSYLGYSTVVGEFSGDKVDDVAVGMPRGYNLVGAVILFDMQLRNLLNLTGEQMGSYFGYALAVADINGDRLDDLIVGAPLFTNYSSNDNAIEKGRVYIYYQKQTHRFSSPDTLDGDFNRGRLGMSLCSAGDLNLDGFADIAVGAPYAGEDGRGLVYIYMGGKNGIVSKPTQVIGARDIDVHLTTFGFSLAGGSDLDGNSYPDLVVGAYKSDRAVILKSRPVVTVTTLLDMPTTVNLENKGNCMLRNGTRVSCFVLNTFVQYSGTNVPDHLTIEVETILDSGSPVPRAFFRHEEGKSRLNTTYQLAKNQQRNNSVYVYMPNYFRDKLSPIKMEAKYRIVDANFPSWSSSPGGAASWSSGQQALPLRQRRDITPILDQLNSTSVSKQIRIGNKCGPDDVCHPALRLNTRLSSGKPEYILGKSDPLSVDVNVENEGEDAFETMFFLNLPPGVQYAKAQQDANQPHVGVTCSQRSGKGENTVICDVANPLPAGQKASFKIFLQPVPSQLEAEVLNFSAKVNSSNAENPRYVQKNNNMDFRLKISADASLAVSGSSSPQQVKYCVDCATPTRYHTERQIGPAVKHMYTIYNDGPTTIEKAQVRIHWPSYTRKKMHLLYLMEQPFVDGQNVTCHKVPANTERVEIDSNETLNFHQRIHPAQSPSQASPTRGPRSTDNAQGQPKEQKKRQTDSYLDQTESHLRRDACNAYECVYITCDIHGLAERQTVAITVRARLWEESLRKMQFDDISISSTALVYVQSLAHSVKPRSNQHYSVVIKTDINPSDPARVQMAIPWWMILVGVLIGLLLLVVIILVCWKCGFFRRKRPGMANGAAAGSAAAAASARGGGSVAAGGHSYNGARYQPLATSAGAGAASNGNGHGHTTPYYAYRYDYADNKYYPERAPGDAYL